MIMVLKRRSAGVLLLLTVLFIISAFGLLSLRDGVFDMAAAIMGAGVAALTVIFYNVIAAAFKNIDRFVLLVSELLWSVGLITLYRIDPAYAYRQLVYIAVGMLVCVIAIAVVRRSRDFGRLNWFLMLAALVLLVLPILFSRSIGGAKNWIEIGTLFTFQPSEFAKVIFIVVSSYFFATRERIASFIPYILYVGMSAVLLVIAKDLGAALLVCGTFLIMFFTATGRIFLTMAGLGVAGVGAVASYHIFSHVRTRVEVWQDPWSTYYGQGFQIVQGLMALASGGLLGVGLGLGSPETIPAKHTDYIFTVICEDFGIIFGILLICMYLVFIIRGMLIAMNARTRFDALLVFGCTCMLTLQSFIILGGVIKLIPLTGITLPFISYGGSSMLASMMQVGIIEGVAIKNGDADERNVAAVGGEVL